MDYGAVLPPSLMVFFCYICYRYCYCLYSGDVGRSPLLLLAKFSYLRALTASTNLECQDSWKVNTLFGFIMLLYKLLATLMGGLNSNFSLRTAPS